MKGYIYSTTGQYTLLFINDDDVVETFSTPSRQKLISRLQDLKIKHAYLCFDSENQDLEKFKTPLANHTKEVKKHQQNFAGNLAITYDHTDDDNVHYITCTLEQANDELIEAIADAKIKIKAIYVSAFLLREFVVSRKIERKLTILNVTRADGFNHQLVILNKHLVKHYQFHLEENLFKDLVTLIPQCQDEYVLAPSDIKVIAMGDSKFFPALENLKYGGIAIEALSNHNMCQKLNLDVGLLDNGNIGITYPLLMLALRADSHVLVNKTKRKDNGDQAMAKSPATVKKQTHGNQNKANTHANDKTKPVSAKRSVKAIRNQFARQLKLKLVAILAIILLLAVVYYLSGDDSDMSNMSDVRVDNQQTNHNHIASSDQFIIDNDLYELINVIRLSDQFTAKSITITPHNQGWQLMMVTDATKISPALISTDLRVEFPALLVTNNGGTITIISENSNAVNANDKVIDINKQDNNYQYQDTDSGFRLDTIHDKYLQSVILQLFEAATSLQELTISKVIKPTDNDVKLLKNGKFIPFIQFEVVLRGNNQ
jgi:hypothetical protein